MTAPTSRRAISARPRLAVATRKGDDGTTGLLYGGARIPKDDLRTEAYGTIDEAVAALGLARAQLGVKDRLGVLSVEFGDLPSLILRLQRELFVAAAELATNPDAWDRLEDGRTRVSAEMVARLEGLLARPRGATSRCPASSSSRARRRRARRSSSPERSSVGRSGGRSRSGREGLIPGPHLLPYLNRLADLLWVLARAAEQAESRSATPSRPDRRRASAAGATTKE